VTTRSCGNNDTWKEQEKSANTMTGRPISHAYLFDWILVPQMSGKNIAVFVAD
jgi:hypothetical protein